MQPDHSSLAARLFCPEQLSFWREHAPDTRPLINEYGPTETVVGCCVYECDAAVEHGSGVPIGRPIANTQLYVLDGRLNADPERLTGELYIGGEGLARCYLNRPHLTAERFVPDPFSSQPGRRLYKTGDLVRYRSDGNLEYLGRLEHQVKVRGFRIELGEIESALLSHSIVREAVVIVREDTPGDKRLVGYLASESPKEIESRAIRGHLSRKLPEYMVPSIFCVPEFTAIDRKRQDRPQCASSAGGERGLQADNYQVPRTPIEESLAEIWSVVLKVEQIGIHADFFELGGHSLLATQVISRINNRFSVEVPLRAIFEAPTIASLSQHIDGFGSH